MSQENSKTTQGYAKMRLYLEELIRNKDFRRLLKRAKRLAGYHKNPSGNYYEWTPKEQKKHDQLNDELCSIIQGYENLRKRCKRVLRDRLCVTREKIASDYGLDSDLINLAIAMTSKDEKEIRSAEMHASIDMCQFVDMYSEELSPWNKGEEIIYLNYSRQLLFNAFPIAIFIHPRASKRDVLDFIEKRWKWIDAVKSDYENERGVLKLRGKRKNSREIVDYIWENQGLPAKKIKVKLDEKFPKNGLVYYEIGKIIQLEKERRFRNLT